MKLDHQYGFKASYNLLLLKGAGLDNIQLFNYTSLQLAKYIEVFHSTIEIDIATKQLTK